MKSTPRIFLSYSWADREVADSIYESLTCLGVDVARDVRENSYTSSIRQFMKSIRYTDYALMLLSDSFLRSPNCMFEVLEFFKDENFSTRLLTLITDDFSILSMEKRVDYISYWESQYKELASKARMLDTENISEIARHLQILRSIAGTVGEFISVAADRITFIVGDPNVDIYPEILSRIGLSPNLSLLNNLRQTEDELYSCRINSEIYALNKRRVDLLNRLHAPQQLFALLKRRFLFQVDQNLTGMLDKAIQDTGDSPELAEPFRAMIDNYMSSSVAPSTFVQYIRTGDELETYLATHLYINNLKRKQGRPCTDLMNGLLAVDSAPYRLLVAAALLSEFELREYADTLLNVLERLIERVEGRLAIEAWVQLGMALRAFSSKKYTTLFMLAHYHFLRYRDAATKPYLYPLLPIHNDIFPDASHYNILLCGGKKEQLSAIWAISLWGADITLRARRNDSPIALCEKSRTSLRKLIESDLDFKEKWRICNALVKTNLYEFSSWVEAQAVADDLVHSTVTIHDPTFGSISEPHCAAFLRACGYLGRKLFESGNGKAVEESLAFLRGLYRKMLFSERRPYVVALTTALGYLGDWRPIFSHLEEREPWMHEAAVNVARYWIDDDAAELKRALSWTRDRLENQVIPEPVKDTLRKVNDALVVRI